MIKFRKIYIGNIIKCIRLKVLPEQKNFVGSNFDSLIQAFGLNRRMIGKGSKATPYAIYADDIMVGFIMYGYFIKNVKYNKHGEAYYYFWRFMIDKNHQGKGYAKKALVLLINEIKQKPHGEATFCYVSYEPTNTVIRTWYQSMGFTETGELIEGELIARLKI